MERITLATQSVTLRHGKRLALDGVSCEVKPGWTAIVGPNGAGKTSLLRILAGLQTPSQGQVLLNGQSLSSLSARERGCRIAWLAQLGEPAGDLTVAETVALGRLPHTGVFGASDATSRTAVEHALQLTGCRDLAERRLHELSGGERQRALLARALATEAPVLLLDEPAAHLDPPHQVAVARLARQLATSHTVVTVLHELNLALAADHVMLLDSGRLQWASKPEDPLLHRALEASFDQALSIEPRGDQWVALPRLGPASGRVMGMRPPG